jgi:hypothetical protein
MSHSVIRDIDEANELDQASLDRIHGGTGIQSLHGLSSYKQRAQVRTPQSHSLCLPTRRVLYFESTASNLRCNQSLIPGGKSSGVVLSILQLNMSVSAAGLIGAVCCRTPTATTEIPEGPPWGVP